MAIEDGELREFSPRKVLTEKPAYVGFKLAGEAFYALPTAPAGVLNDLIAGVTLDDRGDRVYKAPNLISFMCGILRETEPLTEDEAKEREKDFEPADDGFMWVPTDDVRRFRAVVYGKDHVVQIDELGDLSLYIAERLSNRPTLPSARSGRGR